MRSSDADETELYEVMDAGHHYENVKYPDKRGNESEYEVVGQPLLLQLLCVESHHLCHILH